MNLFSIQDTDYHALLRKNIGGLYTKACVKDFEPQIDSCIALFQAKLSESTEAINLSHWINCFAWDVMSAITVSTLEAPIEVRKSRGSKRWLTVGAILG